MIVYITRTLACMQYVHDGGDGRPHACGMPATIGLTRNAERDTSELIPLCALHWVEATHRFGKQMSMRTREAMRTQSSSWRASPPP